MTIKVKNFRKHVKISYSIVDTMGNEWHVQDNDEEYLIYDKNWQEVEDDEISERIIQIVEDNNKGVDVESESYNEDDNLTDEQVEKLWCELEDITFVEDDDSRELILGSDWLHFESGTDREIIWHWFDKNHSKGVAWLLHEYEMN